MDDLRSAETSGRGDRLVQPKVIITPEVDEDIFEISGNGFSILKYRKSDINRKEYKYLKVNVMGNQTKNFSYAYLYFLISMIVLFLFPLVFAFMDCCKRRISRLFTIDLAVYEAIGDIIGEMKPREVYLVVQDNFFN